MNIDDLDEDDFDIEADKIDIELDSVANVKKFVE